MKKVLIIAYHTPPDPGIGALRPLGLGSYLPEFGWEPQFLTAKMESDGRDELKQKFKVHEALPFDMLHFLRHPFSKGVTTDAARFATPQLTAKENEPSGFKALKHRLKSSTAFPDRHNGWWIRTRKMAREIVKREGIDLSLIHI